MHASSESCSKCNEPSEHTLDGVFLCQVHWLDAVGDHVPNLRLEDDPDQSVSMMARLRDRRMELVNQVVSLSYEIGECDSAMKMLLRINNA